MKYLFMLMLVGVVSAGGPSIDGGVSGAYSGMTGTDGAIDSYPYDLGTAYSTGYANFTPGPGQIFITADDFEIAVDGSITELRYWMINTDGVGHPTEVDVFLYADAAPGPGAVLQTTTGAVVSTVTAFSQGSSWIYECMITLDTPFTFDLGTVYWIAPFRDDGTYGTWYCMVGTVVRGAESYLNMNSFWQVWSIHGNPPLDVFRVTYGTATPLERDSWGFIKTIF